LRCIAASSIRLYPPTSYICTNVILTNANVKCDRTDGCETYGALNT